MPIRKLAPIGVVTLGIMAVGVFVATSTVGMKFPEMTLSGMATFGFRVASDNQLIRGVIILVVGSILVPLAHRILSDPPPRPRRH